MFSSSQFEAGNAFSGGGFMPSQFSQLLDSTPSPAKNRDSQGLIPVTVKQISEASHSASEKSSFVINGVEVTNVTLVGMVFDKDDKKFTEVSFTLDDGTGRIECRRWVNEAFETNEMEIIQDGMYVRLNGHLKSFQGKKQLVVFSVRPLTNFDEVTFHYIECVHFYLRNSKSQQAGSLTQSQMKDSAMDTPTRNQTNPSNHVSAQFSIDGRKSLDELVLDYLKQPSSMERQQGIHLDEISKQLKIPTQKLEDCIHSLETDGMIYSTIDQFHYKHVEA